MKSIIKALGLVLGIVFLVTIYSSLNILATKINENQSFIEKIVNLRFRGIESKINELDEDVGATLEMQSMRISLMPTTMKINKENLERKLQDVNVIIINKTVGTMGSGVNLKYKGEYYILSAGHLLDNKEDLLVLKQGTIELSVLQVLKHKFNFDNANLSNSEDLLLLKVQNRAYRPKEYVELAQTEPTQGSEVYIVGNPMAIEDVISEGRIILYRGTMMYITDNIYYGSSGGGVYNFEGKLVGIVSHLIPIQPYEKVPAYMIYGITRLNELIRFMKEMELQKGL